MFDWLDASLLAKLANVGIENTEQLHLAASSGRGLLAKKIGVRVDDLAEALALADLSRVQWVSPTFARVLVAAGFDSAAKVASADAEDLCKAVAKANENSKYYKGKVGLRDIKRLVAAASYVPWRKRL